MRKLADMLGALGREEVLRAAKAQRCLRDWSKFVGPSLAKRSYPDRYDKGTVWISVEGSAWAQELRMIKDRILHKLKKEAGDPTLFVDLRFGVRPIAEEEEVEEPEPIPYSVDNAKDLSIRELAERRINTWGDED